MGDVAQPETPEQIAKRTLERMRGGDLFDVSPERSERIIAEEIRRAVEAEREACITLMDAYRVECSGEGVPPMLGILMTRIRARGGTPVPAGVMTVDLGTSETEGRVAKIEAPLGCVFTRADGTPYKVDDAIKVGDPVSYSAPLDGAQSTGGTVIVTGVRP